MIFLSFVMSPFSVSDDPLVTLDEVIEAHKELEAEAEALLGGANADVCTYPEVTFVSY